MNFLALMGLVDLDPGVQLNISQFGRLPHNHTDPQHIQRTWCDEEARLLLHRVARATAGASDTTGRPTTLLNVTNSEMLSIMMHWPVGQNQPRSHLTGDRACLSETFGLISCRGTLSVSQTTLAFPGVAIMINHWFKSHLPWPLRELSTWTSFALNLNSLPSGTVIGMLGHRWLLMLVVSLGVGWWHL